MKKKLLIFIPSIEDGGVEKNLYLISNYLKDCGINLEILTANHDKSKKFKKGIRLIGTKSIFWQKQNRFIKYLVCLIFCVNHII